MLTRVADRHRFLLFLIKPSHYDDDGYVIQWVRSAIPSNSLACVYGLAQDAAARGALGEDADIEIFVIDETNARVRPDRIAKQIKAAGGHGMVALVGVQSNQFPRAMDLARPLRAAGINVCVGGFHVSRLSGDASGDAGEPERRAGSRRFAVRRRSGGALR